MDSSDSGSPSRPEPTDPGMFVSHWDDDADIDEEKFPHSTPTKEVLWAAENGDTVVMRRLLLADPGLVNTRDNDCYTPLHRACYNNHAETAELLIGAGADVGARTADGWSPLHSAARWNSCACIRLLLRHGAELNALSNGGLTALMVAASSGDCRDACFLLLCRQGVHAQLANDSGDSALDIAQRSGKFHALFELAQPYLSDW